MTSNFGGRVRLVLSDGAAGAGHARRIVRRRDGHVAFLLHAVHQLVDEVVHLSLVLHFLQVLAHLFVEFAGVEQGIADGLAQGVQRHRYCRWAVVLSQLAFKAALQEEVSERVHQIVEAQLFGEVRDVLAVLDALHGDTPLL